MDIYRLLFRILMGRRLPITRGALDISGLNHDVQIYRDKWGVPHIEAADDHDAWYSLGFCQGQDRTFQLELLLRVVRGQLAELVGRDALSIDRLSRRIGFLRSAARQLDVLDADIKETVEAFAAGVSDGGRHGVRRPPHELSILRRRPTPWTAADVLGTAKLFSFLLPSNWDVELARLRILTEDGPEALEALDPTPYEWLGDSSLREVLLGRTGSIVDRLADSSAAFSPVAAETLTKSGRLGGGGGSNNWVLDRSRTRTGRPMLAADPHLSPSLPPHWYLAHIITPDWAAAGASLVGTPALLAGHNGFCAWGPTAGYVDNTDLFIEEMSADGKSVREGDEFVPCEKVVERIEVKGDKPVLEEVLFTRRGPIVGPALPGGPDALSLRAIWLDALPLAGLLRAHRARSFDEFRQMLADWPMMSLSLVYADESGVIGWQLAGQAPRRRKGWGTIPQPGWDPEAGWEGSPVPFDEMPHASAPACGFLATANSQPHFDGAGPFLGADWLDGYRIARIGEVLDARSDWDIESVQGLQMDQLSLPWQKIRPFVLSVDSSDPDAQWALKTLRDWDGRVAADCIGATIFELFLAGMSRRVAIAKAPRSWQWAMGKSLVPLVPNTAFGCRRVGHLVRLLREQPEGWFGGGWSQEIADALGSTIRTLKTDFGNDCHQWRWGKVRVLTLEHAFGQKWPFGNIFDLGPIPWGGDGNTPSQSFSDPLNPTANPVVVASLRMVVDVGAWGNSRFSLPGGQSGNPLSPHYADLFPLWQRGEGIPIAWSLEEISHSSRELLTLRGARAGASAGRGLEASPRKPETPLDRLTDCASGANMVPPQADKTSRRRDEPITQDDD